MKQVYEQDLSEDPIIRQHQITNALLATLIDLLAPKSDRTASEYRAEKLLKMSLKEKGD